MKAHALLLLAGAAAAAAGGQAHGSESFAAHYSVSLFGIPIARSSFVTTIDGDRFSVEGSLSSAGVAKLFDDTEGTTSASGRFAGDAVQPDTYVVNYTSGKKRKKTAIRFSGGSVTATENVPPLKKRKDRVPLRDADLKSVADPLSATLVRAESLEEVCERTLKIYDGEMRIDLRLSHESDGPIWSGHEGEVVTCRARFIPVSGHREGRDSLEYLQNKSEILITFAELGATGVYAPVQASVGTEIGTVRIQAQNLAAR